MRRDSRRLVIPAWLRIFLLILVLFFVFTVLNAVADSLLPLVLILGLIAFPGPDESRPRLVRLMPWLWSLGMVMAGVFLVFHFLGQRLLPGDIQEPSQFELWATLVFAPILITGLVKRRRWFRPAVVASSLVFIAIQFVDYSSTPGTARDILELGAGVATEALLAIYLVLKFVPAGRSSASGQQKMPAP